MSGVEGLGRLATAGQQGRDAAGLSRALDHLGRHVDRDNVLAARAVLLHEAAQLGDLLRRESLTAINAPTVRVPRQAGARAAARPAGAGAGAAGTGSGTGTGTGTPTALDRARARMDALHKAAARLAATAADYGITEDVGSCPYRHALPTA
jgi:hypothetical protein